MSKCFMVNHDWSHWEPALSASDSCQIKICKKCGKIKVSEFLGFKYLSKPRLDEITDKYFRSEVEKENK